MKINSARHHLSVLMVVLGLVACATRTEVPAPVELKNAPPDSSMIHFLRPRSDGVDTQDNPTLHVNGRPFATLSFGSYASVPLPAGKHEISLVAGVGESKDWNVTAEFVTKPGMTYYVAVWHQRQAERTPEYAAALGPAGEFLFHILNRPSGERAVRFEQTAKDVAEFAAAGLKPAASVK